MKILVMVYAILTLYKEVVKCNICLCGAMMYALVIYSVDYHQTYYNGFLITNNNCNI